MKKIALILALSITVMLLAACSEMANAQTVNEEIAPTHDSATIANPVVETDAEGFAELLGIELGIPEGAEAVSYSVIGEKLGQICFTLNDVSLTARVQPAAEFTDISGMYYTWDSEEDCTVSQREGKLMRCTSDGREIEVCLWYDVVPGLMYSLTAESTNLGGFEIIDSAEQIFIPMQGEVG